MKIDNITINLYDQESGDDCQIHLGYDSGDDMYTNIELSDDVTKKIEEIRKIVFQVEKTLKKQQKHYENNRK